MYSLRHISIIFEYLKFRLNHSLQVNQNSKESQGLGISLSASCTALRDTQNLNIWKFNTIFMIFVWRDVW